MQGYILTKNKKWKRIITFIVIATFLCQNYSIKDAIGANKDNSSCLAPSSLFKLVEKYNNEKDPKGLFQKKIKTEALDDFLKEILMTTQTKSELFDRCLIPEIPEQLRKLFNGFFKITDSPRLQENMLIVPAILDGNKAILYLFEDASKICIDKNIGINNLEDMDIAKERRYWFQIIPTRPAVDPHEQNVWNIFKNIQRFYSFLGISLLTPKKLLARYVYDLRNGLADEEYVKNRLTKAVEIEKEYRNAAIPPTDEEQIVIEEVHYALANMLSSLNISYSPSEVIFVSVRGGICPLADYFCGSFFPNIFVLRRTQNLVLRHALLHEECHFAGRGFDPKALDEGMTEYLALKVLMNFKEGIDYGNRYQTVLDYYTNTLTPRLKSYDADFSPAYVQAMEGIIKIIEITGEEAMIKAYLTGDTSEVEKILGKSTWQGIIDLAHRYERATWAGTKGGLDEYLREIDLLLSKRFYSGPTGQIGRLYTRSDVINDSTLARDVKVEKLEESGKTKLRFYRTGSDGRESPLYDKRGKLVYPVEVQRELQKTELESIIQTIANISQMNTALSDYDKDVVDAIMRIPGRLRIFTINDNPYGIRGTPFGDDEIYVQESIIKNRSPVLLFHEIGELLKRRIETETGINTHIFLRGCGKDIRDVIKMLGEVPDNPNFLVDELMRCDELFKRRLVKGLPPITPDELELIYYNARQGRKGIEVIYGLQDRKFGQVLNDEFSDSIILQDSIDEQPRLLQTVTRRFQYGKATSFTEMRKRLISDRLKVDFNIWQTSHPEEARIIEEKIKEIEENDIELQAFMQKIDSEFIVIDRNDNNFAALYEETEKIVRRLLKANGFNPDNFNFYILDSNGENAFTLRYTNNIFIHRGLIDLIIRNGASKDALAYILAHEIRHIQQWVDDCIKGRAVEHIIEKILPMHADEYDADNALALIDKAGYSVRFATFFFEKILEKRSKKREISFGFFTHPPTIDRIRKLKMCIMRFFWMNFFKGPEYFSDTARLQIENRTRRRIFREMAADNIRKRECKDPNNSDELSEIDNRFRLSVYKYLIEAESVEEFLFIAKRVSEVYSYVYFSRLEHIIKIFCSKFHIPPLEKSFYIALLKYFKGRNSSFFKSAIALREGSYFCETEFWIDYYSDSGTVEEKRLTLSDFKKLLSLPLMGPFKIDSENMTYNFIDNSDIASKILHACATNITSATDIDELTEWMDIIRNWYKELIVYKNEELKNIRKTVLDIADRALSLLIHKITHEEAVAEIHVHKILSFMNFLETIPTDIKTLMVDLRAEDLLKKFCALFKIMDPVKKGIVLDWLSNPPSKSYSKLRNLFFDNMLSWDMELLPGMGIDAETDLDVLFSNGYFTKYTIFKQCKYRNFWNYLAMFIYELNKKYNLPDEQNLMLYEKAIKELTCFEISEKIGMVYRDLFRPIQGLLNENSDLRDRLNIPQDLHPRIKPLVYFFRTGGLLSLQYAFFVMCQIQEEIEKNKELPLGIKDIKEIYNLLLSRAEDIKKMYEEKEQSEKDYRWDSEILPFALFLSYDKRVFTENRVCFFKMMCKEMRITNDLGRLIDQVNEFSALDRMYQVVSVDRGIGINRVFIRYKPNPEDLSDTFHYIIESNQDFRTLFGEVINTLPATVYRNFALYFIFIHKLLIKQFGLSIDMDNIFNLQYMQDVINRLNKEQREKALEALSTILGYMAPDIEMKKRNKPGRRLHVKIEDKEKQRIISEHASASGQYYPFEYTELGGPLSQLDIFVGLLAEGKGAQEHTILTERPVQGSFSELIDNIKAFFPRESNTRDGFLITVVDDNMECINSLELEMALPLFGNEGFREKYAVKAIEKKRVEQPSDFENIDSELKWILHYFPKLSATRDDILIQVIDEKAITPYDVDKVRPYLLKAPENIREKKQTEMVFGASALHEYLGRKEAKDKLEFLLWVFGVTDAKPFSVVYFEYEYGVSLDGIRDKMIKRQFGYYKNVGDTAMEDFIESMLLGDNGILYDDNISREFFENLYTTLSQGQENGILKTIYNAVIAKADISRKYNIATALLKNYSKQREEIKTKRLAGAIRVFLESMGLIGVKLGQFLSSNENIPEEIRNELKDLKDSVVPLNKDVVFDIIAKVYGSYETSPISLLLDCVGSGSIKVVYRALLKNGKEVVVKVKRPDVEKIIEEDLVFLRNVVDDESVRKAFESQGIAFPKQIAGRIASMIREEMDFQREASNQKQLKSNIEKEHNTLEDAMFKEYILTIFRDPGKPYRFSVPEVYNVRNNTLIIEEFVNGKKISEDDPSTTIASAIEIVRQIFVDGFYHADPHTGNILESGADGQIHFIDAGSIGTISISNRFIFYQLVIAVAKGDINTIIGLLPEMTQQQIGKFSQDLQQKLQDILAADNNIIKKILKIFQLLEDTEIAINDEFLSLFRCIGQAELIFRLSLLSQQEILEAASKAESDVSATQAYLIGEKSRDYERTEFETELRNALGSAYSQEGCIRQYRWDGNRVIVEINVRKNTPANEIEFREVTLNEMENRLFTYVFNKIQDKSLKIVSVNGLNVLNYKSLSLYQMARASGSRNQIYLPMNMLYLLHLFGEREQDMIMEYITTYESIRKEARGYLYSSVDVIRRETLNRLGDNAKEKRDKFVELLQIAGAIEELAQRIAKQNDKDLLLHLDNEGRLQIRGTDTNVAIFDLDSENITVEDYELKLTYWDVLKSKLSGRKDTLLEMIPKGLDLIEIRQLLIQTLLRKELIVKDAALINERLEHLEGISKGLGQKNKITISSKHFIDNVVKLGENKFRYNQTSSGVKYLLERIQAGFDVEIINESSITNAELQALISVIFGVRQNEIKIATIEGAKGADYKEAVLLLHEDSNNELLVLKDKGVKTLIGQKGVSINVLITVGIYKLIDKDVSEIKVLLLNLGYTETQAEDIISSGLLILPPVTSILPLINDIASFRRTIDIAA